MGWGWRGSGCLSILREVVSIIHYSFTRQYITKDEYLAGKSYLSSPQKWGVGAPSNHTIFHHSMFIPCSYIGISYPERLVSTRREWLQKSRSARQLWWVTMMITMIMMQGSMELTNTRVVVVGLIGTISNTYLHPTPQVIWLRIDTAYKADPLSKHRRSLPEGM